MGDGGGDMTLLFSIEGQKQAWSRKIGNVVTGKRYGVEITIGPLGTVDETHCERPCALSTQPWWEPWVDRARSVGNVFD
jgi:hypothetical protein